MTRFSALFYFWYLKGGRLFETKRLFGTGLSLLFDKQPSIQSIQYSIFIIKKEPYQKP